MVYPTRLAIKAESVTSECRSFFTWGPCLQNVDNKTHKSSYKQCRLIEVQNTLLVPETLCKGMTWLLQKMLQTLLAVLFLWPPEKHFQPAKNSSRSPNIFDYGMLPPTIHHSFILLITNLGVWGYNPSYNPFTYKLLKLGLLFLSFQKSTKKKFRVWGYNPARYPFTYKLIKLWLF